MAFVPVKGNVRQVSLKSNVCRWFFFLDDSSTVNSQCFSVVRLQKPILHFKDFSLTSYASPPIHPQVLILSVTPSPGLNAKYEMLRGASYSQEPRYFVGGSLNPDLRVPRRQRLKGAPVEPARSSHRRKSVLHHRENSCGLAAKRRLIRKFQTRHVFLQK